MVFEFIRQRAEEGLAQVQNLATKTIQGRLSEALTESADYIRMRQKIDAENFSKLAEGNTVGYNVIYIHQTGFISLRLTQGLARSRARLLSGIQTVFSAANADVNKQLEDLEAVLLQADIGMLHNNDHDQQTFVFYLHCLLYRSRRRHHVGYYRGPPRLRPVMTICIVSAHSLFASC
jgi:hypothetical protein